MFSDPAIRRALDLHQRSYSLLIWMGDAIRRGFVRFDAAHSYSTLPVAALAWLESHYSDFPAAARPAREDLPEFCNLFTTYLESTFDLVRNPGQRLYSPDAHCFCPMCSWLVDVPHLRPKKVTPTDKKRARALQVDLLRALAAEASLNLPGETLVDDPTLREDLAMATWARVLLRRLEGISEGAATLALWRRFAWSVQGSPKPKFRLKPEDILAAEQSLLARLRALSATSR